MTDSKTKNKLKRSTSKSRWWRSESTNTPPSVKLATIARKWFSEDNMLTTPPSTVPYYYGHITRENAELIIWDRGCLDGMYLLRASHNRDAEYVLSIGCGKQVLHYLIQKNGDGMYHLCGMSTDTFVGPVELIDNIHPSSLPCPLRIPCLKPINVFMPGVNCGITKDRLHEAFQKKAVEWGISNEEMKSMLVNKENDVWKLIFKTLHESEGWYHGKINRSEAESRLMKSGNKNGKFLIRERDTCSFTLSLCVNNEIKHYKIDVLSSGEVGIYEGPRFENIISLVSHYSVRSDGLWCCLKYPCLNLTSPVSAREISWPIERGNFNGINSSEPQPAFPLNRPIYPVLESSQFFNPRESDPDPKKPSPTDVNNKADSNPLVKKLVPLRPPPPVPVKIKPAVPPLSVMENVPMKPVRKENGFKSNDILPLSPTIAKDQNHNICSTIACETNPSSLNTSSESSSGEIGCAVGEALKQKPVPVPRARKVPLVLSLANQNGKVVEKTNNETRLSPWNIAQPSSTSNGLLLSPSSINNNVGEIHAKSTSPSESVSPIGPKSPNLNVPKQLTGPLASSSLVNVLLELRNHKVMSGKDKDNISPPPAVTSEVAKAISSIDNIINTRKVNTNDSPPSSPSNDHPPLRTALSGHSIGEPNYEEIDPDYELDRNEQENSSNDESSQCLMSLDVQESKWDELEENSSTTSKNFARKPPWTKEESELHFKTIKRHRTGPVVIHRKNLVVQERLGVGNFGEVSKALFKSEKDEVPCAVKTLRPDHISNGKEEILREARIMTKMDHPHIVRLLGVSEGEPFLLVMELAPLGPLSIYLKRNPNIPTPNIMFVMYQVALGMEYLESRQFVHRDLAARNVLLVNDNFAKITDFGMSKALGLHSDYYTVEPQGRLPLKWYAPECIYYFKFSSKSDVWSYGITLWEALSRGAKPYMGMTGREILRMFADNTRLLPPENCPSDVYAIMSKCWAFSAEDRPSFSELVLMMQDHQKIT